MNWVHTHQLPQRSVLLLSPRPHAFINQASHLESRESHFLRLGRGDEAVGRQSDRVATLNRSLISRRNPGLGAAATPRPSAPSPVRTPRRSDRCPNSLLRSGPRARDSPPSGQAAEVGSQTSSLTVVPPFVSSVNAWTPPAQKNKNEWFYLVVQCSILEAKSA